MEVGAVFRPYTAGAGAAYDRTLDLFTKMNTGALPIPDAWRRSSGRERGARRRPGAVILGRAPPGLARPARRPVARPRPRWPRTVARNAGSTSSSRPGWSGWSRSRWCRCPAAAGLSFAELGAAARAAAGSASTTSRRSPPTRASAAAVVNTVVYGLATVMPGLAIGLGLALLLGRCGAAARSCGRRSSCPPSSPAWRRRSCGAGSSTRASACIDGDPRRSSALEGPAWLRDPAWAMPAMIVIGLWNVGRQRRRLHRRAGDRAARAARRGRPRRRRGGRQVPVRDLAGPAAGDLLPGDRQRDRRLAGLHAELRPDPRRAGRRDAHDRPVHVPDRVRARAGSATRRRWRSSCSRSSCC